MCHSVMFLHHLWVSIINGNGGDKIKVTNIYSLSISVIYEDTAQSTAFKTNGVLSPYNVE